MPHEKSWKQLFKDSFVYTSFLIAIIVGFFSLYIVDQILRIKDVHVSQSGPRITVVGTEAFEGNSTILLETKDVEYELKRQNPRIETITVTKVYPSSLSIQITTRGAVVALQGDVGYYMLASDGTILEKLREEPKGAPKISYYQKLPFINNQAGKKVDYNDIAISLDFYRRFQKLGLKVVSIDIQDYSMIRFLFDKEKEIRISAEKDKENQWYQIERLVKDLRIQGQEYKLIDVRFEKPYYEQSE